MTDQNQEPPKKLYVWVVSQDGEHRIRKWDTKPFDEATHECGSLEYLYQDLRSAHAAEKAAWEKERKDLNDALTIVYMKGVEDERRCRLNDEEEYEAVCSDLDSAMKTIGLYVEAEDKWKEREKVLLGTIHALWMALYVRGFEMVFTGKSAKYNQVIKEAALQNKGE